MESSSTNNALDRRKTLICSLRRAATLLSAVEALGLSHTSFCGVYESAGESELQAVKDRMRAVTNRNVELEERGIRNSLEDLVRPVSPGKEFGCTCDLMLRL
jgi:hypothetical protein